MLQVVPPGQESTHWDPRLAVLRGLLRAGFLRLPGHLLRSVSAPGPGPLPGWTPPRGSLSSGYGSTGLSKDRVHGESTILAEDSILINF